jgi:pilus assembly protein FimV
MAYRIVVADKDPACGAAVKAHLAELAPNCVPVSSASELKKEIKANKPDLIILNAVLPDVPGWRIVPKFKDSKEFGDIPILLLTGDPGSPSPGEVKSSGADRYLSKPIKGGDLRRAVESLLGAGDGEDEIVLDMDGDKDQLDIEFSADELGDEEPPTDVGDTVEIDAATLEDEVGALGDYDEDGYGDTVKLNLDDMELAAPEEGVDFEPTIELAIDAQTELLDTTPTKTKAAGEAGPGAKGGALPDFAASTVEIAADEKELDLEKDSFTVDLDVGEMSLNLDADDDSGTSAMQKIEDEDDTDIEALLEVQEPSHVLTSEDVLGDESLMKDTASDTPVEPIDVDIIDLEQNEELAGIDGEELEGIVDEEGTGPLDFEATTMPMESGEMELLAKGDLDSLELDDSEAEAEVAFEDDLQASLEEEAPSELDSSSIDVSLDLSEDISLGTLDGADDISLDAISTEDVATEEYFGGDLPTQEFVTDRLPEELETGELAGEEEISIEEEDDILAESSGFESFEEVETSVPAEAEAEKTPPPSAVLNQETLLADVDSDHVEITEEISVVRVAPQGTTQAPEVSSVAAAPSSMSVTAALNAVADMVRTAGPQAPSAGFAPVTGGGAPGHGPVAHAAPHAQAAPPAVPHGAPPEAFALTDDHLNRIREAVTSAVESALARGIGAPGGLAEVVGDAVTKSLPAKDQLTELVAASVKSSMPSPESFPTPDALVARITDSIDAALRNALPGKDELSSRLESALKSSMPKAETVQELVVDAAKASIEGKDFAPSAETISQAFAAAVERGVSQAVPAKDDLAERFESAVRAALPDAERLAGLFEAAVKELSQAEKALPDREQLVAVFGAKAEDALRDALPASEEFRTRFDNFLESLDSALRNAVPRQDALEDKVAAAVKSGMPGPERLTEALIAAVKASLDFQGALPSAEALASAISEAVERKFAATLPGTDALLERFDKTVKGGLPEREALAGAFATVIKELALSTNLFPDRDTLAREFGAKVDEAVRDALPAAAELRSAFDRLLASLEQELRTGVPGRDALVEKFSEFVAAELPRGAAMASLAASSIRAAVQTSVVLPTRDEIAAIFRSLAEHGVREGIPEKEDLVSVFRSCVQADLPSGDRLAASVSNELDNYFRAAMPTGEDLTLRLDALLKPVEQSLREALPKSEQLVERFARAVQAGFPDKDRAEDLVTQAVERALRASGTLPSPEQILSSFVGAAEDGVMRSLPESDELARRVDHALRESLPSGERWKEMLVGALDGVLASKDVVPGEDKILALLAERFDGALKGSIPTENEFLRRFADQVLRSGLPDRGSLADLFERSLESTLPTRHEMLDAVSRLATTRLPGRDEIMAGIIETVQSWRPSEDALLKRVEDIVTSRLPSKEEVLGAVETALSSVPPREDFLGAVERAVGQALPSQRINRAIDEVIGEFPTRDMVMNRMNQALDGIPGMEEMLAAVEGRLAASMPPREEIEAQVRQTVQANVNTILAGGDLAGVLRDILPTTEQIVDKLREGMPDRARFQEIMAAAIARAIDNSLPERIWLESVSRGLFDERTRFVLPNKQEVTRMLRDEIQSRLLETVERVVKNHLDAISKDLDS